MNFMDGLLIGRFQPFHLGHLDAVLFGLSRTENLFIGIGSSNNRDSSCINNPISETLQKKLNPYLFTRLRIIRHKFLKY